MRILDVKLKIYEWNIVFPNVCRGHWSTKCGGLWLRQLLNIPICASRGHGEVGEAGAPEPWGPVSAGYRHLTDNADLCLIICFA